MTSRIMHYPESLLTGFDGRLAAALHLATTAGDSTLEYFQTDRFAVERKGDNSPVTIADKNAERLVRERLAQQFPNDAILGEEFGTQAGSTEFEWIVDPIDGTKSFIGGVPMYSTLLALVHQGKVLAGAIYIPPLREMIFAVQGRGAWWSYAGKPAERAQVSTRDLAHGMFVTTQFDSFRKRGAETGLAKLEQASFVTRTWGDGYGYLLVATGRAEVMVDPIANPWDLASVQIVIDEAGGRFSSWQGKPTYSDGDGIGSNGVVHAQVLSFLAKP
ncbi:MAG: inositol monophosphatase [Pirellulaceae bacterium]|nr:inositol monophosphatase [Pirellulaceae bacterium]